MRFTINRKPISIIKELSQSSIKNLELYTLGGSLEIDLLVEKFKVKKDVIKIKRIKGKFGTKEFKVLAHIYHSKEDKDSVELKKKKETSAETKEKEHEQKHAEEHAKKEEAKEIKKEKVEAAE